jgi:glucan biosynthesis protein C
MSQNRIVYMDWGRVLFMMLGIPYHAGLAYVPGSTWDIRSPDASPFASAISGAIHAFYMPAFFVIAGYFAAMTLARKESGAWLRSRFVRLGVPFIAAIIILNPLQTLTSLAANPDIADGHLTEAFLTLSSTPGKHWVRHLWFLSALMLLSIASALLWHHAMSLMNDPESRVRRLINQRYGLTFIAAVLVVWHAGMLTYPKLIHVTLSFGGGLVDLHDAIRYAPYYTIGLLLFLDDDFLTRFTKPNIASSLAAISSLALYIYFWRGEDPISSAMRNVAEPVSALFVTQTLMSLLKKGARNANKYVSLLSDISFTMYLVHLPIVLLLAWGLLEVPMRPAIEFLTITVVTAILSIGIGLLIRQSVILTFLFNGVWSPRRNASNPVVYS